MSTLPERQRLILAADLSSQEKLVLLALSIYVGNNESAWVTVETLASDCGLSRRRLHAHLTALAGRGIVSSQRRRNQPALRSINWHVLDATLTTHPGCDADDTSRSAGCDADVSSGCDAGFSSGCDVGFSQKGQRNNKRNNKGGGASETNKRSKRQEPVPVPPEFNTPDARTALDEWREHRKQLRKPLTALAESKLLKKFAALGPDRFVRAVEHSIENGWQGLFEPAANNSRPGATGQRIVDNADEIMRRHTEEVLTRKRAEQAARQAAKKGGAR